MKLDPHLYWIPLLITAAATFIAVFFLIRAAIRPKVPEDFSFTLTWGMNGISSYDSTSGKLVKSSIEADLEKYTTQLILDEGQRAEIYRMLKSLRLEQYPGSLDPFPDHRSKPTTNIILTMTANGKTRSIVCHGIGLVPADQAPEGARRRLAETIESLIQFIAATPEWQSLPPYKVYVS
ncbi:MAG: hypothetical protein IJM90_01680 [Firmicutes bacterium]|nr:hypothetical protein [Bacillota bacterium]